MDWQIIFWNVQITRMVMAVCPLNFAFHWGVTSSGWLSRGCDSPVLPNPPFSDNRKCLSHFSIQHITHFHQNVTNNINFKNCLNIPSLEAFLILCHEGVCGVRKKWEKREMRTWNKGSGTGRKPGMLWFIVRSPGCPTF